MSPIRDNYWSVKNEMLDEKKRFTQKLLMRARERIRMIEDELPDDKTERENVIKNRFLSKPLNMQNRRLLVSENAEEYFSILSLIEQGLSYDENRHIELEDSSQEYIDEFVNSELHEEVKILEEQIVRFFFWNEYVGNKIKITDLTNIDQLIGAVGALEVKEAGFKVNHDYNSQQQSKADKSRSREIGFANKIDTIITNSTNATGAKPISIRMACKIYRDEFSPHVSIRALQNRYSKAKQSRKDYRNARHF